MTIRKFIFGGLMLLAGIHLMGQTSYVQLGSDINGASGDDFGWPVASSSDGTIIAVAATSAPNLGLIGQVKVYELSGSSWVQKGTTLSGQANGDSFGKGLSLSSDGTIMAIGSPHSQSVFTEFSNSGRVYIYQWIGNAWVGKDTLDAAAEQENFGDVLSLSDNGDVLAVGVPGAAGGGTGRGAARVFKRNGNDWIQIGSDINGVADFETFGTSVSVVATATDSVLAIGAVLSSLVDGADDYAGKVHIYRSSIGKWGGSWSATDSIKGTADDYFGYALSLASDGSKLVVGAPQSFLNPGTAYAQVYEYNSGWSALGSAISSNLIGDEMGKSVALSSDGSHVLVGAPTSVGTSSPNGYVELYKFESTEWVMQDSIAGAASDDAFGSSVAINNDGSKFVVGAPYNDDAAPDAGQVVAFHPFVPDAIKPTVTLSTNEHTYTSAKPFTVTFTFSEQVTGFVVGDITVGNGNASNLATSDNIVFTASITPVADGVVSIDVAADVAADLSDNTNEAAAQLSRIYDGTGPAAVLSSASGSFSNSTFNVNVAFGEKVTGFLQSEVVVTNGTISSFSTANNIDFTLLITPEQEGAVTVNVAAGVAADSLGNGNIAAQQLNLNYDLTSPMLVISEISDTTNLNPTPVVITFSEKVKGFALADITVSKGSPSNLLTADSILFTVDIANTAEGINTIDVATGVVTDLAGNGNIAAVKDTLFYDITAPTIELFSQSTSVNTTNLFTYYIAFSEKIKKFDLTDITFTNATADNLQLQGAFWGNSVYYTVDITPNGKGDIYIELPAAVVQDIAGNDNIAATRDTVYFDVTAPGVVISSTADNPTAANSIEVNVTFTEKVSGFALGDLNVSNGKISDLSAANIDSVEFTVQIIPDADGVLTVDIAQGVAHDLAGNNNTAATQFSISVDLTAPSVVISSAIDKATNDSILSVDFTFSERVRGFDASDITVDNGTATNLHTNDSISFTVDIEATEEDTVLVDLLAGKVTDLAGIANVQANQLVYVYDTTPPVIYVESPSAFNDKNFMFVIASLEMVNIESSDIEATNGEVVELKYYGIVNSYYYYLVTIDPSGDQNIIINIPVDKISDLAGNSNKSASRFELTYDNIPPVVAYNKLVTNKTNPKLTGTIDDIYTGIHAIVLNDTIWTSPKSDLTWSIDEGSFSTAFVDGTYDVKVIAWDYAYNTDTLIIIGGLTIDTQTPQITVNSLVTNNVTPTITGTVSDDRSGVDSVIVTINEVVYLAALDGGNWSVAISSELSEGSYNLSATASDKAGNKSTDATDNELRVDLTKPTVEIQGVPAQIRNETLNIKIVFSEEVTGFELTDLAILNATASNLQSTDARTYTASIAANTGLKKGDVITLNIAADVVKDAANNGNTAAIQVSVTFTQKYSGGLGTETDPYLIATEADLREISTHTEDLSSYFKQIANIEMGPDIYTPIGNFDNPFTGTYNGQGFVINKLSNVQAVSVRGASDNLAGFAGSGVGLFGEVTNATLKNITLTSIDFNYTSKLIVGGLVAEATNSTISKCYVTGSIVTNGNYLFIGGLIGVAHNSTISESFTDIAIYDNNSYAIGGLLGSSKSNNSIMNSYSLSNITVYNPSLVDRVHNIYGGLAGEDGYLILNIDKSYYAGIIYANTVDVGGITAKYVDGEDNVTNSFWDTDVSGLTKTAGGGTGLTTDKMKNLATYTSAGWDFKNETANGTEDIWTYAFYYPFLSWQLDRLQDFTISGKVVDENGNVFNAGTVKAYKDFVESGSATLDADGKFSLDLAKGQHLLVVVPNNSNQYMNTYYGNTNNGFKSKIAMYHNSGVEIQMIAKSQQNLLDGNGRVKGRVVKNSKKAAEIVQGNLLEGEGLEGVTVFLVRVSDGQIMTSVVTDANGEFEITGIPEGEYQLMLDVVGIDANLDGSTFTMDEEGTPLVISAVVGEDGVVFDVGEETVGIKDQVMVTLYPNPVNSFVNIQVSGQAKLRIIDMRGTVVAEKQFADKVQLNLEFLKESLYIIEIQSKYGIVVKKLIKNN